MQEAEEPTRGGNEASARAMSPIAAFVILLAVVAAVFGGWLLTREDEPTPTQRDRGPAFALSDEEAIERFKQLEALQVRAYRRRDLSLLSRIFVPGGESERVAATEIRRLIRADVLDKSTFQTQNVGVIRNTPTKITVRQTVVERVRFVNEAGRNVTTNPVHERLVIDWYLVRVNSEWRVSREVVVAAHDVVGSNES
jgi:hypothetical protein